MKSMTGFGSAEFQNSKIDAAVEIKSLNNRYLDISVNIPSFISSLEPQLRNYLSEKALRGKIDLNIRIRELEENVSILIDSSVAEASIEALNQLNKIAGTEEKIHLSHLLRMEGIIKKVRNRDTDSIWEILQPIVEKAYLQFDKSRDKEAEKISEDINNQIASIKKSLRLIESRAADIEEDIKKNLKDKFLQVLGESGDETRIYAEIAVQLIRFSINEEIVRLYSHLGSMEDTFNSSEQQIGKKLDFICQEINREINTIGSKSFIMEISQAVIEIKDSLEKIREQVRNIC